MTGSSFEDLRSALRDLYTIERELGQGGMATVYLARDLKHGREVAVKVLHPELTAALGAERFLREVDVLAHLQHPHILPLFDSGHAEHWLYYVMPRVDGPSLRDRLRLERQLPVDDALRIAGQVAAALDYAHRHHVIHRDIKPENILLQDGQALVADFGIALALSAAGADRLTGTGISLGTPRYMSPEQATGDRQVDARTDVYSLGAVLYEVLTGEPPHDGPDARAVIARVLTEPARPIRTTRSSVPPHVDAAVQQALAKLPADRFPTAAEFARALTEASGARAADASARPSTRARWPMVAAVTGWAVVAAGLLVGATLWVRGRDSLVSERVRRSSIVLPDSAPLAFVGTAPVGVGRTSLAITRDGSRLVYVAQHGATTQLHVLALDQLEARPIPGTAGAHQPFFSPDGRWVGFFVGDELRKVSLEGGQPVSLARAFAPFGAAWADDDRILVVDQQGNRMSWVRGEGGPLEPIERRLVTRAFSPGIVADGRWILHGSVEGVLYLHDLQSGWPYAITRDGIVRRDSADLDALLFGANPRWLESGHIAYFSGDGALVALPFDMTRRRVLGPPAPVLDGIRLEAEAGDAQLAIARDGTLVYARGESARLSRFVWVDHVSKAVDTLPFPMSGYGGFDLSPDGRRIAVRSRSASGRAELWTLDIATGVRAQVPADGLLAGSPRWLADGANLLYHEIPTPDIGVRLTLRQSTVAPHSRDTLPLGTIGVAPNGRDLIRADGTAFWLLRDGRVDGPVLLARSRGVFAPSFSPDGRWIAYMDQGAVFAGPVGNPDERHKISAAEGEDPVWTPDGRRLLYRNGQAWWSVDISTTGGFSAGRPRELFRGPYLQVPGLSSDLAPDGRRHLVLLGPDEQSTTRLVMVSTWFAEVARLAPRR